MAGQAHHSAAPALPLPQQPAYPQFLWPTRACVGGEGGGRGQGQVVLEALLPLGNHKDFLYVRRNFLPELVQDAFFHIMNLKKKSCLKIVAATIATLGEAY